VIRAFRQEIKNTYKFVNGSTYFQNCRGQAKDFKKLNKPLMVTPSQIGGYNMREDVYD
jgi:hypothetical protein